MQRAAWDTQETHITSTALNRGAGEEEGEEEGEGGTREEGDLVWALSSCQKERATKSVIFLRSTTTKGNACTRSLGTCSSSAHKPPGTRASQ